jgi:hypothetical protein
MENRENENQGTDNARMRAAIGRGRDASARPDQTGIRSGEPENSTPHSGVDTNDGQPSRQTSTAKDMEGQL